MTKLKKDARVAAVFAMALYEFGKAVVLGLYDVGMARWGN